MAKKKKRPIHVFTVTDIEWDENPYGRKGPIMVALKGRYHRNGRFVRELTLKDDFWPGRGTFTQDSFGHYVMGGVLPLEFNSRLIIRMKPSLASRITFDTRMGMPVFYRPTALSRGRKLVKPSVSPLQFFDAAQVSCSTQGFLNMRHMIEGRNPETNYYERMFCFGRGDRRFQYSATLNIHLLKGNREWTFSIPLSVSASPYASCLNRPKGGKKKKHPDQVLHVGPQLNTPPAEPARSTESYTIKNFLWDKKGKPSEIHVEHEANGVTHLQIWKRAEQMGVHRFIVNEDHEIYQGGELPSGFGREIIFKIAPELSRDIRFDPYEGSHFQNIRMVAGPEAGDGEPTLDAEEYFADLELKMEQAMFQKAWALDGGNSVEAASERIFRFGYGDPNYRYIGNITLWFTVRGTRWIWDPEIILDEDMDSPEMSPPPR